MTHAAATDAVDDPFDLARFVEAQQDDYAIALAEVRAGQKRSHWMWYIFPQFVGLGHSAMSQQYALKSTDEAKAYLQHPLLGPRLVRCFVALLELEGKSANQIFGSPDDMKLHSCATLFAKISPQGSVFEKVLQKYFAGESDASTIRLIS